MAGDAMNDASHRLAACVAALLLLASCGKAGSEGGAPPLAGAAIGGPFALTDQDGRAVTGRTYAGRYRIVYFGYTFCPDVCPTTLQTVMRALHGFVADRPSAAGKIVPIFISVDPARDTPAVMKQYVAAFGTGLVGLTGTPQEIAKVAKEFGVYYQAQPPKNGGAYLVDHSSQAVLFDPSGAPIVLLPTDQGADAVKQELARWVQ
ncbi:MAG: SCO family protein [Sphingomonadaceae bacterium]|nr:SCO family protein [Sphingomonadaceae bacterium]